MDTTISGFEFLKTMQKAREIPEDNVATESGKAVNMPPMFSDLEEVKVTNEYTNTKTPVEKVGIETYYDFYSRVFVIDRPYEVCARCQSDISSGKTELCEDEEYVCPHTQSGEYHALVAKSLKGEAVIQTRDFYNDLKFTRRVHVEWLEANPEKKRMIQKQEKDKARSQVYPPRPELAFAKSSKKESTRTD